MGGNVPDPCLTCDLSISPPSNRPSFGLLGGRFEFRPCRVLRSTTRHRSARASAELDLLSFSVPQPTEQQLVQVGQRGVARARLPTQVSLQRFVDTADKVSGRLPACSDDVTFPALLELKASQRQVRNTQELARRAPKQSQLARGTRGKAHGRKTWTPSNDDASS